MISVIIPVYNRGSYIVEAIASATSQSTVSAVIVIDDASTDNTREQIEHYFDHDSKVTVLSTGGVNRGSGYCRNLGLEAASSPYISFLDSDDIMLPQRYEQCIQVLESRPSVDGIYDNVYSFDSTLKSRVYGKDITMPTDIDSNMLFHFLQKTTCNSHLSLIGLTLRASVVNDYRFDTQLRISQDTDYLWEISRHLHLVHAGYDESYVKRRIHDSNVTKDRTRFHHYRELLYHKWLHKSMVEADLKPYRWHFFRHYAHWKAVNRHGLDANALHKAWAYLGASKETLALLRK